MKQEVTVKALPAEKELTAAYKDYIAFLGRRNIPPYVRAELALKLKPEIERKAKERMLNPMQNSAQGTTRDQVAKAAGVSHDTIHKVDATPRTVQTYTGNIRQFIKWIAKQGISRPDRQDILAYREDVELLTSPHRWDEVVNPLFVPVPLPFRLSALRVSSASTTAAL